MPAENIPDPLDEIHPYYAEQQRKAEELLKCWCYLIKYGAVLLVLWRLFFS